MTSCAALDFGPCDNVADDEPMAFHFDGCHYDSPLEAFGIGVLGFCGCGDPEGMAELVASWLRWRKEGLDGAINAAEVSLRIDWTKSRERWQQHEARKPEMTGREELLIAYLCDDKGLTEHGGSVYGSWLTETGEQWLAVLSG